MGEGGEVPRMKKKSLREKKNTCEGEKGLWGEGGKYQGRKNIRENNTYEREVCV